MPVVFKCSCGSYLSVSKKNIGKRVVCPECEEIQQIPDPRQSRAIKLTKDESRRLRHGEVDDAKSMARERVKQSEKSKETKKREKPRPEKQKKKGKTVEVPQESGFQSAILEAEGIGINCFCGARFSVPAEKAGKTVECEQCGRQVAIPDPDKVEQIELAPLDDDEKCPYCGVSVSGSELKCHSCGKNLTAARRYNA